jgi:protein SCO1/2
VTNDRHADRVICGRTLHVRPDLGRPYAIDSRPAELTNLGAEVRMFIADIVPSIVAELTKFGHTALPTRSFAVCAAQDDGSASSGRGARTPRDLPARMPALLGVILRRRNPGGVKRAEGSPWEGHDPRTRSFAVYAAQDDGSASSGRGARTPRDLPARMPALLGPLLLIVLLASGTVLAETSATPPRLPGKVDIVQKLDAQIPLDLMFRNEQGKIVRLRELFHGKPVLLNFMYYRCPMLCSMVMEGVASALTELKFDVGKEFDVITLSIDPRDTSEQAAAKKDQYVKRYGRLSAANGWHFLTGHESAIKKLTDSAGFYYAYDPKSDQFAHGTALLVLTPDGRISRYFYGFEYKVRDLRLGLVEASAGKIGTPTDQLLLLCYHYDPATGKYSRSAMNFVRAGGVATLLSLGGFIFVMIRRERRRAHEQLTGPDKDRN